MAESASTPAQSSAHFISPTLDDLAIQTCDDAETLNAVLLAYTAFEKIIEPGVPNYSEVLTPTRSELSALLGLLNEALVARIDAVNAAAGDMRRALMQGSLPSAS
ncbi:hypothetical protein RT97_11605 [Variovorax paradoxus]|uniref:Uncharacterized protein n=1 Tax=Variovorax paradoxus TaxID=34073 RepID=A0A0D0LTY1_VARPD|nr:hypothetical protein [Variovorax paradoxus]KIQ32698.1 hypothetical protein RT97_11605 [Variovorax paradoxus]